MVQAQEYINVPPRERPHWNQYEIPESQINKFQTNQIWFGPRSDGMNIDELITID